MNKSLPSDGNGNNPTSIVISGKADNRDILVLACDHFILGVFLWDQLRYGMDMLFIIIPLAAIAVYLIWNVLEPEQYCFTDTKLEIRQSLRHPTIILYENVFNMDVTKHDDFVNISRDDTVKLYYTKGKRKTTIICRPTETDRFIELIRTNCSVFHLDTFPKSDLDILFSKQDNLKGDA